MSSDDKESMLQLRLKNKLAETGISVNALEKQAGLKRSAVQNIIHGKSKKPSANVILAITKVLGCPIQELISPPSASAPKPQINASKIESSQRIEGKFHPELYAKATNKAINIFKDRHLQPTNAEAIDYILEIYQYSLKGNQDDIDNQFAEWFFDKSFMSK